MEYFIIASGIISLIISLVSLRISLQTSKIQKTIELENILFAKRIECYEKLTELLVEYCTSVDEIRNLTFSFIDNHQDSLKSQNMERFISSFEEKERIIGITFYKNSLLISPPILVQLNKFLFLPEFKEGDIANGEQWSNLLDKRFDEAEALINEMRIDLKFPNLELRTKHRVI